MKQLSFILMTTLFASFIGCASMNAYKNLNETAENTARGDANNPIKAKEYLQSVLSSPAGRQVKAYHRRAYSSDNKKTLFAVHSFYVFSKDGETEHTLVYTATPKGSELNGCWMLDAYTDVESYGLFLESQENPWEVEEYQNPARRGVADRSVNQSDLNLLQTTQNILDRLDKGYTFFGPAHIRNLPWYHLVWLALTPPPILALTPILLMRHTDNCNSAVLETMVWERM
ncbi:MAG: hypothetical protein LBQ38_12395 [Spirochaetaceae bacterium]|jgi:hypothetical protein|nr:hypothetical protein [Spirochaetaceae bacterium]